MAAVALKKMVGTGQLKVGHFLVEFATPGIGYIMKAAGAEFCVVDMEHSGFTYAETKSVLRYIEAAGLPTIVRVPSKAYDHIARAADIGAEGIMLPMVGNVEEAQQILASMKYPPTGQRGVALGIAHDRFATGAVLPRLKAANQRICLFAQIETAEGVENADKIAALDGVDCLWIGHFDLSCSLGIPGKFTHKKFIQAVEKVVAAGQAHGKSLGRLAPSVESAVALRKQGFDFISYSGDVWAFQEHLTQSIATIRKQSGRSRSRRQKQTG